MDNCQICNHKEHKPNECKQCNCGQSEMIYPSSYFHYRALDLNDYIYSIYTNPQNTVRYEKGAYKLCQ